MIKKLWHFHFDTKFTLVVIYFNFHATFMLSRFDSMIEKIFENLISFICTFFYSFNSTYF